MKYALTLFAAAALPGCAVLSNVSPIGDGAFMTAVHSNDVNATVAEQKAKAMGNATAFCGEKGATVDVLKTDASAPPPGQAPSARLEFRCRGGR